MIGAVLVFAGGGSLGAVQVGMLRALVASGVEATCVVGASVGSINAARFAAEPGPAGVESLTRIWCGLRRRDVFPGSPLQALLGAAGRRDALLSSHGLDRLLRRELPYARIEDAAVPLHVVATDLGDGSEVLLSVGPVVPALLASAAIPGVFAPVDIGGRTLVDGGVASNTPVTAALALGADPVVVLPTGSPCAAAEPARGALGVAVQALNLLIARQLVRDLERHADEPRLRVVPPLCPLACAAYDFSQAGELIARAEASTRDWIDSGGLEMSGVPAALHPHQHA